MSTLTLELRWEEYFCEAGITPFVVVYENLVKEYEETAIKTLEFLGIPVSSDLVFGERRMKKQADDLSENWVNRYLEMKRKQLSD